MRRQFCSCISHSHNQYLISGSQVLVIRSLGTYPGLDRRRRCEISQPFFIGNFGHGPTTETQECENLAHFFVGSYLSQYLQVVIVCWPRSANPLFDSSY